MPLGTKGPIGEGSGSDALDPGIRVGEEPNYLSLNTAGIDQNELLDAVYLF